MEVIPKFKKGTFVRIMQTDRMVKAGLANKTGTIIKILDEDEYGDQMCMVQPVDLGPELAVRASSLCETEWKKIKEA